MADTADLLVAAERIIREAERDLGNGLYESACVAAQRGAVIATEAMLQGRSQVHISDRVLENVSYCAEADDGVRKAAELLDRYRAEEGSAHRSALDISRAPDEAPRVIAASLRIFAFAREQLHIE